MADEELSDDDKSFMHFFERLTDKCQSLNKLVETKIAEAMKNKPSGGSQTPAQSGSYLEEQNRMLLQELLSLKKGNEPSIPDMPGQTKDGLSTAQPLKPNVKPDDKQGTVQKIKAVWR